MREAGDGIPGFPLAFERKGSIEVILLGVIPVGQVALRADGRLFWWINLPMIEGVRLSRSWERAHADIKDAIAQWLEAASAPHTERQPARATA
jgi:hypothetical protein